MLYAKLKIYGMYKFKQKVTTVMNLVKFKMFHVHCGSNFSGRGLIYIRACSGRIEVGNNVRINSARWANPIGNKVKTSFQIIDNGQIIIGNNVGISNTTITSAESVTIGNNVLIGSGTEITDTDFHELPIGTSAAVKTAEVVIEDNVSIGSNCTILKGTHIGHNSVIGANSVVTKTIPAGETWAGIPAKRIK